MNGSVADVWDDPDACCRWLNDELNRHGIHAAVSYAGPDMVLLAARFDPVALGEPEPYPAETATIVISPKGKVMAIPPLTDTRTWKHRYAWTTLRDVLRYGAPIELGQLCLWYPKDPAHLRWDWSQGLATFLLIVQRHFLAEEYHRRHRHWPVEDAPHGDRDDGKAHPVLDPDLRAAS